MNISLDNATLCLARNRSLTLARARGTLIRCLVGGLWITQDHDHRDIVLAPGESFVLDRDGTAIVMALRDAGVEVRPASELAPGAGDARGWAAKPPAAAARAASGLHSGSQAQARREPLAA